MRPMDAMRASLIYRRVGAVAAMVIGVSLVFGLVLAMNAQEDDRTSDQGEVKNFAAVKARKKKEKKKKHRLRRRKVKRRTRSHAPTPSLGRSVAGISFGIPGLEDVDLDGAELSVLGGDQATQDVVMTEDALDVAPRPRTQRPAEYPRRARSKGVTGKVLLRVLVGTDGKVESVRVIEAEPEGVFEQSAVEAIKSWTFEPGLYKGQPVKSRLDVPFLFQLT